MRVTRQSKKEELWQEVERLRVATEQQRTKGVVLESEAARLRVENERLLERTRFMEELSQKVRSVNEKLEILTSLTKELASFDLDGVLEVSVKRIPYLVGARFASVYLYDRVDNRLLLKHHTHGREIDPEVNLDDAPNSLMSMAVREKRTLCINDLGTYAARGGATPKRPHSARYKTSSCVIAPLIAAGEVEGVLNLADRFDARPFDSREQVKLIEQACELVAVSLRNARLFEQIQQAARMDSLTGLLNHQAFTQTLEIEAKRAARYGNKLALVVCRINGIRLINANYGHQAGDQVIMEVGELVAGNIRDVDISGRTGGTEFGLILPEQPLSGALVVAERLSGVMAQTRFMVGEAKCELRATLGVAEFPGRGTGSELLQTAQEALLKAREEGERIGTTQSES